MFFTCERTNQRGRLQNSIFGTAARDKLLEFWKTWKPGFGHWPGVDA